MEYRQIALFCAAATTICAQTLRAAPATQPATAPATRPTTAPAARHKDVDPRWRQINESMRNNTRHWATAPITQTMPLDELVHFSLSNGSLRAEVPEFATAQPVRIAVKGTKSVWMLTHNPGALNFGLNGAAAPRSSGFTRIERYDYEAHDDEFWNSLLMMGENFFSLRAQHLYGNTMISQNPGAGQLAGPGLTIRVCEYGAWGQPQKQIYTAHASSMQRFRDENPDEFRKYVVPVLAKFSDLSFLIPGPADVYSAFTEISADQAAVQKLAQILPKLDADNPEEREMGSAKLRDLGTAGVLAAPRWDETNLSEEQKARLELFVDGFRRRNANPATNRRDPVFLVDCLEYPDPVVRAAAKAELERQSGHAVAFDPTWTGPQNIKAADALRKEFLAAPPATQPAPPTTQPATKNGA